MTIRYLSEVGEAAALAEAQAASAAAALAQAGADASLKKPAISRT